MVMGGYRQSKIAGPESLNSGQAKKVVQKRLVIEVNALFAKHNNDRTSIPATGWAGRASSTSEGTFGGATRHWLVSGLPNGQPDMRT